MNCNFQPIPIMQLFQQILIISHEAFWCTNKLATDLLVNFMKVLDGMLGRYLVLTDHSDSICFRIVRTESGVGSSLLKLLAGTEGLVLITHEVQATSSLLVL